MASILKVDTLQKPDGSTPTAADLGVAYEAGQVVQSKTYFVGGDPTNGNYDYLGAPTGGTSTVPRWDSHVISVSSQTPVSTDFAVSITPKFANSIIRIEFMGQFWHRATDPMAVAVVRDATTVVWSPTTNDVGSYGMGYNDASSQVYLEQHVSCYDKPATTSSVEYRLYVYKYAASTGASYAFGHSGSDQHSSKPHLTVTEIAQ
jgi:hypothetical protein